MKKKIINIVNLYSNDMNIYGDYGNVLCIVKRLQWYGFDPKVIEYNQGDIFPEDADIIIGGGGQDSGQEKIQKDLITIGPNLKKLAEDNVPMLVVCGLYQLFGKFFKTNDGHEIKGIGLLDIETFAKSERLIGNIKTQSEQFGEIIGYENHSGQTFLGHGVETLGRVRLGAGNNTADIGEGARYRNVIGTYLHGSILPKNPAIADFLISQAVINRYGKFKKKKINNHFTEMARKFAMKRPR